MQPDRAWATAAAGLPAQPPAGRRRRPEPRVTVTIVLRSDVQVVLPADSALARAIGQVAGLLAHW
jgi:hypothetical protein